MSAPGPTGVPTQTGPPAGPVGDPRVHLARGYSLGSRATAVALGALGAAGLVVAAVWPVSSVDSGTPTCIFRLVTGLPCPGCGMTRAWVHVAHGDLTGALLYNPFGVLLMAMAAFAAGYVALALVRGRPPEAMLDLVRPRPAIALVSAWILWSVYRMWSISAGQDLWAVVVR